MASPEIYNIASGLVDTCLRQDGSLFSADRNVWTLDGAQVLDGRVGAPIQGKGNFLDKLERQLDGLAADAVQLAAELFYVQLLTEADTSGDTKSAQINRVLRMSAGTSPMPDQLEKALYAGGVAAYGAGKAWRDAYMRFLIRFLVAWKSLNADEQDVRLASPWAFRELVNEVRTSTDSLQANALLHLIFPHTFSDMIAPSHRHKLTAAFAKAPGVAEAGDDEDRRIEAIWKIASEILGPEHLYTPPFRQVWDEDPTPQWTELVSWATRIFERDDFDTAERDYKLALAGRVRAAREALEADMSDWLERLFAAFRDNQNNLTDWRAHDKFISWSESNADAAQETISTLWRTDDRMAALTDFLAALPNEAASGPGTRLSIATFLRLGSDPTGTPFFKWTPYRALRAALGLPPRPETDLDPADVLRPNELAAKLGIDGRRVREFLRETFAREAEEHGDDWILTYEQAQSVVERFRGTDAADTTVAIYADWLELLEQLLLRLLGNGVRLRDLLDAQSIVWWVLAGPIPEDWPEADRRSLETFRSGETTEPTPTTSSSSEVVIPPATAELAAGLHLPQQWLQENILELLAEKKQLIFYGPPGTGKTFVAQKMGDHLAANGGYTRLVQFHPSYTYEDFFEGYRPVSSSGEGVQFKLVPGALRELAARAREHPAQPHLLIVDEINRGNVAKVFGELYFLLEYRDAQIGLQYSRDERFELPENLFVIGTMNTADRSIALVDSALRRRFYFVGFLPTQEPVRSVLRKWLERHELDPEPAALLDKLNEAIGEEEFSIGPSYFMTADGSPPRVERVWEHALKPLLEEHFYGAGRDVDAEFGVGVLLKQLTEEADAASASPADQGDPAD